MAVRTRSAQKTMLRIIFAVLFWFSNSLSPPQPRGNQKTVNSLNLLCRRHHAFLIRRHFRVLPNPCRPFLHRSPVLSIRTGSRNNTTETSAFLPPLSCAKPAPKKQTEPQLLRFGLSVRVFPVNTLNAFNREFFYAKKRFFRLNDRSHSERLFDSRLYW